MRLVVGLGNPGAEYLETPHNAGFWVCDRLAARHHFPAEARKWGALFRRARIGEHDVGLLKPQTYMNRSGDSVAEALRYLPLEIGDLILVYDEIDLPAGRLRVRPGGGHGGHNGMRSVIERIGSSEFPRVRVGIGRPAAGRDPTPYLLGKLPAAEREHFLEIVDRACDAVETLLREGVAAAMNRHNASPQEEAEGPADPDAKP